MPKIRTAIVGVGNCASSLVQGVNYYRGREDEIPGLISKKVGGYGPGDIEFIIAFDIDKRKIGKDLSEAIFAKPNCTAVFNKDIPFLNCPVKMGYILDGVAAHISSYGEGSGFSPAQDIFHSYEEAKDAVVKELKENNIDVIVNYLPVGSEQAARFYADCAICAKVAFVNAMPVFISQFWGDRFREAGVPILGDDIKSQIGATIVHRVLTSLFEDRGQKIKHTYQLNVGGNTDFLNMLDRSRLQSKKISKTGAVTSMMNEKPHPDDIHIGPSDYIPWLKDRKICFLRIEGEHYGGVPMHLELRLEVEDSPNSAGVITDAIRAAKLAKERGLSGPIAEASAYLFKSPIRQYEDSKARDLFKEFIK